MVHRFHVLAVPHAVTTPAYSFCAFTQKILKICQILHSRGHTVIHYGHQNSQLACTEHVTVTNDRDLKLSYGDHDWQKSGFPAYRLDDHVYKAFYARTIAAIYDRKEPGDFLLCPYGGNHKPIADAHKDLIAVEPGIGYPDGGFAPFRVFESYAVMHAYLGQGAVKVAQNNMWYDAVIPNCFDLNDFEYSSEKDDYFLFLGRVGAGKGVHIAMQMAEALDFQLLIAGPGSLSGDETTGGRPVSQFTKMLGVVDPISRKRLLSRARAVIAASTFLEPFCGVQIEAMLSGTPVISTDWGAFAEYNLHGVTGYRCKTFEQFLWAARNIDRIKPQNCRQWAEANFSLERVGDMYEEYFDSVRRVYEGKGWYSQNDERKNLDWLEKHYPDASAPG